MTSENVKAISAKGPITVGYITIGEDEELQVGNGKGPGGKASWYFDRDHDDVPDQDGIWKSWYTNANDPEWRASRVEIAKKLVDDYGFQGIFLDVVSVSEMYPESRGGMIQMLHDLREALPDKVIVMNQGFDILAEVAPLIDGLMLESFTATYDFDSKKYMVNYPSSLDAHMRRALGVINPVVKPANIRVLVLDYAGPQDKESMQFAANRAASLGYLFSAAPIYLDAIYPDVPAGESDPKWLEMHATPAQLAFKLPEPRNGFPAGTIATPSGCFPGYCVETVTMPTGYHAKQHWSKSAWASAEDGSESWLEIAFPEERKGGKLLIDWNNDTPSRQFSIQVRNTPDGTWRDVDSTGENTSPTTSHLLPSDPYRYIRIYQDENGGSSGRPHLMWITRVELVD